MKKAIAVAAFALLSGTAIADAQFGIETYPGAKEDTEVAQQLKKSMNLTAKTYRTGDSVTKVTEFYRKQKSLTEGPASSDKGSMFTGKGATLTVQNPWMDMKSGKINNDTLISIVPNKK